MKCFKRSLGLFAVAILVAQYPAQAAPAMEHVTKWPAVQCRSVDCLYEMEIVIHTPSDSASGNPKATVTQRLMYQNTTPESINSLKFVGPKPAAVTGVGGRPLLASDLEEGGAWRVELDRPLEPGGAIELRMQFDATLRDPGYGFEYRTLSGLWHPKVVDTAASSALEGINATIASYNVSVAVPEGWRCVASGLKREEQSDDGKRVLRFAVDHVADFAIVLTRELQSIEREVGGVSVELFHKPERKEQAEQMADLAADVVRFYIEEFGFYPQPYLCIVMLGSGFGGGPVGGNIVRVNDSIDESLPGTAWGVAHEIGHEYWGFECVVDSDHLAKWFGLGMGLHSDEKYCRTRDWDVSQHANIKYDYTWASGQGRDTTLIPDPLRPVDNDIAHGKGLVVIELLNHVLGEESFNNAVREFLTTCRYRRVPQNVIEAVFQNHAPEEDMREFFHGWLETSGTLDYAIKEVISREADGEFQIDVKLESKGKLQLPVPVEMMLTDGTTLRKSSTSASDTIQFRANHDWYLATIDPDILLPDVNRDNNAAQNANAPPIVEILQIDVGDTAWGRNVLKVKAKNVTDREQKLWLHIGGGYPESSRPAGFGMGMEAPVVLVPGEERTIEHMYWVPPLPGKLSFEVKFVLPRGSAHPSDQYPFLVKQYSATFETPNSKCNELTPQPAALGKQPLYEKYRDGARIPAFEHFETEHFVFYCSPGTPAHQDIETIKPHREKALSEICGFLGVSLASRISCFFYPDAVDKRTCTNHQGDGLAFDDAIAEIYNDKTKLDPYHELTHIVAGQIGSPPALFEEGFAVYMQAGHIWKGQPVDKTAAELLRNRKLTPLSDLVVRTEVGSRRDDGEVAYPESASFVKFLIDEYGKDRFLRAYRTLKSSNLELVQQQNLKALQKIYGESLEQLERKWQNSIKRR